MCAAAINRVLAKSPIGFGAAYGTAKSGVGVAAMGVMRPELVMRNIIPVVMAGVIGIYGLIIAVIVASLGAYPLCDRIRYLSRRSSLIVFRPSL